MNEQDKELMYTKLLDLYKPILVLYIPDELLRTIYAENKLNITISRIKKDTNDKYFILVIPSLEETIKIDLLSVIKENIVKDKDLERHLKNIQDKMFDNFEDNCMSNADKSMNKLFKSF